MFACAFSVNPNPAGGRWNPIYYTNGDFNGDGFIDMLDFAILALFWFDTGPAIPVDLYPDNSIDIWDAAIFAANWLEPGESLGNWETSDDVTSPCVDAGDPASDHSQEPAPNGDRVNMGTYGNTPHASKPIIPIYDRLRLSINTEYIKAYGRNKQARPTAIPI